MDGKHQLADVMTKRGVSDARLTEVLESSHLYRGIFLVVFQDFRMNVFRNINIKNGSKLSP